MFKNHELVVNENKMEAVSIYLNRPWLSRKVNDKQCKVCFTCNGFKDWLRTYRILFL